MHMHPKKKPPVQHIAPRDMTAVRPKAGPRRATDDIDFRDPGTQPEIAKMMGSQPWDEQPAPPEPAVRGGAYSDNRDEEADEIRKFYADVNKKYPKARKRGR